MTDNRIDASNASPGRLAASAAPITASPAHPEPMANPNSALNAADFDPDIFGSGILGDDVMGPSSTHDDDDALFAWLDGTHSHSDLSLWGPYLRAPVGDGGEDGLANAGGSSGGSGQATAFGDASDKAQGPGRGPGPSESMAILGAAPPGPRASHTETQTPQAAQVSTQTTQLVGGGSGAASTIVAVLLRYTEPAPAGPSISTSDPPPEPGPRPLELAPRPLASCLLCTNAPSKSNPVGPGYGILPVRARWRAHLRAAYERW
jgi:hypothetical protein